MAVLHCLSVQMREGTIRPNNLAMTRAVLPGTVREEAMMSMVMMVMSPSLSRELVVVVTIARSKLSIWIECSIVAYGWVWLLLLLVVVCLGEMIPGPGKVILCCHVRIIYEIHWQC